MIEVGAAALRAGDDPAGFTGVRWPDGTVECRARVMHPSGSLVARDSDVGVALFAADVGCDRCSDACV